MQRRGRSAREQIVAVIEQQARRCRWTRRQRSRRNGRIRQIVSEAFVLGRKVHDPLFVRAEFVLKRGLIERRTHVVIRTARTVLYGEVFARTASARERALRA